MPSFGFFLGLAYALSIGSNVVFQVIVIVLADPHPHEKEIDGAIPHLAAPGEFWILRTQREHPHIKSSNGSIPVLLSTHGTRVHFHFLQRINYAFPKAKTQTALS